MFYTVVLTQSRSVDLIKVDAFYSTSFCLANTTRIYKENNLFLYAVLCLEVFALSESVVSAAREHLFNEACKIIKSIRKVRDLRIGIRHLNCMICKFKPILPVNKLR